MNEKARLAPPQEGYWKAKGKNGQESILIPFSELEDDHLQRAYFVTQNKTLEFFNKSIKFEELGTELEKEAERRGIQLRSIEDEPHHKIGKFFANSRKLKEAK